MINKIRICGVWGIELIQKIKKTSNLFGVTGKKLFHEKMNKTSECYQRNFLVIHNVLNLLGANLGGLNLISELLTEHTYFKVIL